jgi:hypothetical protein
MPARGQPEDLIVDGQQPRCFHTDTNTQGVVEIRCSVCDTRVTDFKSGWQQKCRKHLSSAHHVMRATAAAAPQKDIVAHQPAEDSPEAPGTQPLAAMPTPDATNLKLRRQGLLAHFAMATDSIEQWSCVACGVLCAPVWAKLRRHCQGTDHQTCFEQGISAAQLLETRSREQAAREQASAIGEKTQPDGTVTTNGSIGGKRKCTVCSTPEAPVEFASSAWATHAATNVHNINRFITSINDAEGVIIFDKIPPRAQTATCFHCKRAVDASLNAIMDHLESREHRTQPMIATALQAASVANYVVSDGDLMHDREPVHAMLSFCRGSALHQTDAQVENDPLPSLEAAHLYVLGRGFQNRISEATIKACAACGATFREAFGSSEWRATLANADTRTALLVPTSVCTPETVRDVPWHITVYGEPLRCYALHPEMVKADGSFPTCATCTHALTGTHPDQRTNHCVIHTPKLSYAAGYDFGYDLWREQFGLEPLTPMEAQTLALCAPFSQLVQMRIERSAGDTMKRHTISMPVIQHDVIAKQTQLPREDVSMSVLFIGSKSRDAANPSATDENSRAFRERFRRTFQVRARVIQKWVEFLLKWNPLYQAAGVVFNAARAQAYEERNVEDMYGAAITSNNPVVAAATCIAEQGLDFTTENRSDDEHIMLRSHVLASERADALRASLEATLVDSKSPALPWEHRINLSTPVNEFRDGDLLHLGGFPHLFPCCQSRVVALFQKPLSVEVRRLLLLNVDKRWAEDGNFGFLQFNQMRRHATSRAISVRPGWCNHPTVQEMKDDPTAFLAALAAEEGKTSTPKTLAALKVVRQVSAQIPFSDASRKASMRQMIAHQRYHGYPSVYITFSPKDGDVRLTMARCVATGASAGLGLQALCADANEALRKRLAQDHPSYAADSFAAIAHAVLEELLGTKHHTFTHKTHVPKKRGLFGVAKGFFGVIEAQSRGALHMHLVLFSAPIARMIGERIRSGSRQALEEVGNYAENITTTAHVEVPEDERELVQPRVTPCPTIPNAATIADALHTLRHRLAAIANPHLHKHTVACFKNATFDTCRYGCPWAVVPKTGVYRITNGENGIPVRTALSASEEQKTVDVLKLNFLLSTPAGTSSPREGVVGYPPVDTDAIMVLSRRVSDKERRMSEHNPFLAALLGCNTNVAILGAHCQAAMVMFYLVKYLSKPIHDVSKARPALKATNALKLGLEKHAAFPEPQTSHLTAADKTDADSMAMRAMRRLLSQLANAVSSQEEVSAQIALYAVLGNAPELMSSSIITCNQLALAWRILNGIFDDGDDDGFGDDLDDAEGESDGESVRNSRSASASDDADEEEEEVGDGDAGRGRTSSHPSEHAEGIAPQHEEVVSDDDDAADVRAARSRGRRCPEHAVLRSTTTDGRKALYSVYESVNYLRRGPELKAFNFLLYTACVEWVPHTSHTDEEAAVEEEERDPVDPCPDVGTSDGRGRKPRRAFLFDPMHTHFKTLAQVLRSKARLPSPLFLDTWSESKERFSRTIDENALKRHCESMAALFIPLDTTSHPEALSFSTWRAFLTAMRCVGSRIPVPYAATAALTAAGIAYPSEWGPEISRTMYQMACEMRTGFNDHVLDEPRRLMNRYRYLEAETKAVLLEANEQRRSDILRQMGDCLGDVGDELDEAERYDAIDRETDYALAASDAKAKNGDKAAENAAALNKFATASMELLENVSLLPAPAAVQTPPTSLPIDPYRASVAVDPTADAISSSESAACHAATDHASMMATFAEEAIAALATRATHPVRLDESQRAFVLTTAVKAAERFCNRVHDRSNWYPSPCGTLLHGGPGTGKTETVRCLMAALDRFTQHFKIPRCYVPCAMWGNAAKNIGGETCHRLFGFPFQNQRNNSSRRQKDPTEELNKQPEAISAAQQEVSENIVGGSWRNIRVVIIDEISCVDRYSLHIIDKRLGALTGRPDKLFGGVLVVAVGDFYQLPPVCGRPLYASQRGNLEQGIDDFDVFDLNNQHRTGDSAHATLLQRIRDPNDRTAMRDMISSLSTKIPSAISHRTAILVSTREEVSVAAKFCVTKYARCTEQPVILVRVGGVEHYHVPGAPSLCTVNRDADDLRNGTPIVETGLQFAACVTKSQREALQLRVARARPGDIIDISRTMKVKAVLGKLPENVSDPAVVPFHFRVAKRKKKRGESHELEIMSAFAFTFHKCQGLTIDEIIVDFNQRPSCGMGAMTHAGIYVGLSRVRDPSKLHLVPPRATDDAAEAKTFTYLYNLYPDPEVVMFVRSMQDKPRGKAIDRSNWDARADEADVRAAAEAGVKPPRKMRVPTKKSRKRPTKATTTAPAPKKGHLAEAAALKPPKASKGHLPERPTAKPTAKPATSAGALRVTTPLEHPEEEGNVQPASNAYAGIQNEKYACYANASLQFLYHGVGGVSYLTPELVAFLESVFAKIVPPSPMHPDFGIRSYVAFNTAMTVAAARVFERIRQWDSPKSIAAAVSSLRSLADWIESKDAGGRLAAAVATLRHDSMPTPPSPSGFHNIEIQHDAQEFLNFANYVLSPTQCDQIRTAVGSGTIDVLKLSNMDGNIRDWQSGRATGYLSDIATVRSSFFVRRVCSKHGDWNNTRHHDSPWLAAEITFQRPVPLRCSEKIRGALCGHALQGMIGKTCDEPPSIAVNRSLITNLKPPRLLVHFKRFLHAGQDGKILGAQLPSIEGHPELRPTAFILHHGEQLNKGHYIAYVKIEDAWYEFNDATVTRIDDGDQLRFAINHCYLAMFDVTAGTASLPVPAPAAAPDDD